MCRALCVCTSASCPVWRALPQPNACVHCLHAIINVNCVLGSRTAARLAMVCSMPPGQEAQARCLIPPCPTPRAGVCSVHNMLSAHLAASTGGEHGAAGAAGAAAPAANAAAGEDEDVAWQYARLSMVLHELHCHLVEAGAAECMVTQRAFYRACVKLPAALGRLRGALEAAAGAPASGGAAAPLAAAGGPAPGEQLTSFAAAYYAAVGMAFSALSRDEYTREGCIFKAVPRKAAAQRAALAGEHMLPTLGALRSMLGWHDTQLAHRLAEAANNIFSGMELTRVPIKVAPRAGHRPRMLGWALAALLAHLEALESLPVAALQSAGGQLAQSLAELLEVEVRGRGRRADGGEQSAACAGCSAAVWGWQCNGQGCVHAGLCAPQAVCAPGHAGPRAASAAASWASILRRV